MVKSKHIQAFAEVKTPRGSAFGSPGEAVGPRKQRQIVQVAKWYLNDKPHKGYGSQKHREAVARYGPCVCHRRSFAGVKEHCEGP